MQKWMLALMVFFVLIVSGCASSGGAASASANDGGGLPEIAAYDDEAFDPLPDMVAAEL
jgi:hypothetical protein